MKKKIAIKGRGTAGAFSVTHFLRWTDDEIDWYFDPTKPTQAVGESTNLILSESLSSNIGFHFSDLPAVNGTYKRSIYKKGWGARGLEFEHPFLPPSTAIHIDCLKFQDYILDYVKDNLRVNIIPENINSDDIDANHILDCSGRPTNYDDFILSEHIPVNSTHVIQCSWNNSMPTFDYTLMLARPYGWVFGIPLQTRCSMGYLYNKNISSLEEVKNDLLEVIEEFGNKLGFKPTGDTITFNFSSYYKKNNFDKRIAFNGNASFFLEPMEASSIGMMDKVHRIAYDHWYNDMSVDECQMKYTRHIHNTEHFIGMHYAAGSIYNNEFWTFAKNKGINSLKRAIKDEQFMLFYENSKKYLNVKNDSLIAGDVNCPNEFSFWWLGSFSLILPRLDLYSIIEKLKEDQNG